MASGERPINGTKAKVGLRWIALFLAISFGVAWGAWFACGIFTSGAAGQASIQPAAAKAKARPCGTWRPCA